MASATTTATDLIVPAVWADVVGPKILGRAALVALATVDDTLVGEPGDSVTFPKFKYIGDADDLTEGVAMETVKLEMTDSKATIKEAGKAVEMTDKALLTSLGQPDSQAETQLAISVARKIDKDLRAAAELVETVNDSKGRSFTSQPLKVAAVADKLSWAALTAGIALFGDEYDPQDIAAYVIHSQQYGTLLNDANFLSADKFGAGAVLLRGQIGSIGGVPVIQSDRTTRTGTGTGADPYIYNALIVKKGALALMYKRRPIVEKDRDVLKRTTIITTNVHYAVKRVDDRGIVVVPTKVPAVVA